MKTLGLVQSPLRNPVLEDENLRIYLRIRPMKCNSVCLKKNDRHSVTLFHPEIQKSNTIYGGFSYVFANSSQDDVFKKMFNSIVEDFMMGKSGMLAALGPSGSGKTYTIFGTPKEAGMITRAFGRMFSDQSSRTFYLSMFEICSEGGRSERMLDLCKDGIDMGLKQSTIRGLHETVVCNVKEAEALIAKGTLRRATAVTNLNSHSSRSQCIVNIRCETCGEANASSNSALLTIVDLAGAERNKRTGNQGARLLESNSINNTLMVFGLCLRSLLEHQKNRKKPLQKHYQDSMLTRYLRDYLEGKKRMALILTVKSGEEDYLDTSFVLRQASPYMKIKFASSEEPLKMSAIESSAQAVEGNDSASFLESRHVKVVPRDTVHHRLLLHNQIKANGNVVKMTRVTCGDDVCGDDRQPEFLSDSDIYLDENDDIILRKDTFLSSYFTQSQDSLATVNGTKQLCMICNVGDQLLVCSSESCRLVVHERCIGGAPTFDARMRFYCPFCAYSRAISMYSDSKTKAILAKNTLLVFISQNEFRLRNSSNTSVIANQNLSREAEVSDECVEQYSLDNVDSRENEPLSRINMIDKPSESCDLSSREGGRVVTCEGNEVYKPNAERRGSSVCCQSPREQEQPILVLEGSSGERYEDSTTSHSSGIPKPEQHPDPSFSHLRRKKVLWSIAEEEALKEGVRRFTSSRDHENFAVPWKKILESGANIFEKRRTPVDLKDKWRNICKRDLQTHERT